MRRGQSQTKFLPSNRDCPRIRRFHANVVDKDNYLLEAIRYIHLNPIKVGLVNHPSDYLWSSYHEYIGKIKKEPTVDSQKVLEIFSGDISEQKRYFKEFIKDGLEKGTLPKEKFTLK